MERQYDFDYEGDIDMGDIVFAKGMEHLCGEVATITDIESDYVSLEFENYISDSNSWTYTVDMIEKV